jgi:hypothetical protein
MSRRSTVLRSSPVLPLALLLTACPDTTECTLIGCLSGVTVDFAEPLQAQGAYTFSVDLDGDVVTCVATLPLTEEAGDGCDDERVMLWESGSALAESEHELPGMDINGEAVEAVVISVALDGVALGSASFSPEYSRVAPNGEECGPVCDVAGVTVDFE